MSFTLALSSSWTLSLFMFPCPPNICPQFIEDVESYMKGEENAEAKIKSFDEVHQKYKFMENSLAMRCCTSDSPVQHK